MNLPFSTGSPYSVEDAAQRKPARSNIDPDKYTYLFTELLPYRGMQGEVIAYLLNKLHAHLTQRTDIGNYTKPDGTVHGVPDVSYIPIITRAIESFDFRFSSHLFDRPADNGNDGGTATGPCDPVKNPPYSPPNPTSETISAEGLARLGRKIRAGSD